MSCATLYVVRTADGAIHLSAAKYGAYHPDTPQRLAEVVAHALELPRPAVISDWLCRGCYIDVAARELRFYACAEAEQLSQIETILAHTAAGLGPAFTVRYAWHRLREVLELAGVPELCPPERGTEPPDLGVVADEVRGLSWDRDARVVRYPQFSLGRANTWISIIEESGEIHDVGLAAFDALPALLALGPDQLEILRATPPIPPDDVDPPRELAIFDRRRGRALLWSTRACTSTQRWTRWTFERMTTDLADQLARTGRRIDDRGIVVADPTRADLDLSTVRYVPFDA